MKGVFDGKKRREFRPYQDERYNDKKSSLLLYWFLEINLEKYICLTMFVMFSMVATMTGDGRSVTNNDPERKCRSRKGKVYESP